MGEWDRIALLAKRFPAIGDDCAVVCGHRVWTVDVQVEGTHFKRQWLTWEDLGFRSYMAAASDLAAMGAEPEGALSALVLSDVVDDAAFDALTRGQAEAAALVGAPIVGGNLARGKETSVTTTLLGRAAKPVMRSGARVGDLVLVAGNLGLAAKGLALLQAGKREDPAIDIWRRPRALIAEGLAMRELATSAIDVSDGLVSDANHIATASKVRIVLDAALSEDERYGGEDYALLITSPHEIPNFRPVGTVVEGSGITFTDGTTPTKRGFDHFG